MGVEVKMSEKTHWETKDIIFRLVEIAAIVACVFFAVRERVTVLEVKVCGLESKVFAADVKMDTLSEIKVTMAEMKTNLQWLMRKNGWKANIND